MPVDNPSRFAEKFMVDSPRLMGWDYSTPSNYFVTICTVHHNKFFGNIIDNKMILSKMGMIANQCLIDIPKHFDNVKLIEYIVMPNHVHILMEIVEDKNLVETCVDNLVETNDKDLVETRDKSLVETQVDNLVETRDKSLVETQVDNLVETRDKSLVETQVDNLVETHDKRLVETLHCNVSTNQNNNVLINQTSKKFRFYNQNKIKPKIRYISDERRKFYSSISPKPKSIPTIIRSYKSAVTKLINPKTVFFGWQTRFHDEIIRDEKQLMMTRMYIRNNVKNWSRDEFNK